MQPHSTEPTTAITEAVNRINASGVLAELACLECQLDFPGRDAYRTALQQQILVIIAQTVGERRQAARGNLDQLEADGIVALDAIAPDSDHHTLIEDIETFLDLDGLEPPE